MASSRAPTRPQRGPRSLSQAWGLPSQRTRRPVWAFRGRRWKLEGLALGLLGAHQGLNLGVSLALLEALDATYRYQLRSEAPAELNGVQVRNNQLAFEWGRRCAHDLAAVRAHDARELVDVARHDREFMFEPRGRDQAIRNRERLA